MQIFFNIGNAIGQFAGYILWFFFDVFDNYVFSVFCFTLFIKICSFPFELKGRKAMARTARINKKRLELEKKYKNDRQKLSEETTKLYQQEGVNPAGGCLPQLFPMFAFMGVLFSITQPLTNMLHISADKVSNAIDILPNLVGESTKSGFYNRAYYSQLNVVKYFPKYQDSFTMFNETEKGSILNFHKGFNFFGLDLTLTPNGSSFSDFIWLIPVLCIVTNFLSVFLSQKLNSAQTGELNGCMKFTPYLMSIPYILFVFNVPAGVGVYYIIFNFLAIVQTMIVAKFYSSHILTAKEEAARIALLDMEEKNISKRQ